MSGSAAWDDEARWEALKEPRSCPVCVRGAPLNVVAELATTWVTAPPEAPLPGYACVVSKLHVVEPFELPPAERAAFWEEAMVAAQALSALYEPVKMNYEVHGNTIPHLHLHLFPRFPGDPFAGGPVDARLLAFTRSAEELARMRRALAGPPG